MIKDNRVSKLLCDVMHRAFYERRWHCATHTHKHCTRIIIVCFAELESPSAVSHVIKKRVTRAAFFWSDAIVMRRILNHKYSRPWRSNVLVPLWDWREKAFLTRTGVFLVLKLENRFYKSTQMTLIRQTENNFPK